MNIGIAARARQPLAVALFIALAAPGAAWAQTAKEQALEARVAELERQVQALLSATQHQQGQLSQTMTQLDQVRTVQAETPPAPAPAPAPVVPAGKAPIQVASIIPAANPGSTFKVGGFMKADFLTTSTGDGAIAEGAVGRYLYIPAQTPVGGESGGTDTDFHAKFSRINFGVDTVTDNGDKMSAFVEFDFFGNALATQVNNLYGSTLRHAYLSWNNWLAGQYWSNFVDILNFPESADILGPTDGILFSRQAQIRYTNGGFSVSAENPYTLYTAHNAGAVVTGSDRGGMPDLTARYTWKGDWGNFSLAGIGRQFRTRVAASNDAAFGGAVSMSGRWVLNADNDLRYQLTYGEGIARYLGLGNANDVDIDADGKLLPVSTVAGWFGWSHRFTPKLRSTIMYSRANYDHDVAATGPGATSYTHSLRANLFYSPLPKLDVGAEAMYGEREIESGEKGDIKRVQFTTKYSF